MKRKGNKLDRTYLDGLFDFLKDRMDELSSDEVEQLCWRYEDDCEYEVEDWHESLIEELGCERYAIGCSKIVLFFEEYPDVVIKIPFDGIRTIDYDKDYEVVDSRNFHLDYCAEELNIWYEAINAGVEKVFAEEAFIGRYRGVPLYVAERCSGRYRRAEEPSEDSKNKAKKMTEGVYLEVAEYLPLIIHQYGEEFAEKVLNFVNDYSIDDLHDNNVGLKDGMFKFIDYSSYDD